MSEKLLNVKTVIVGAGVSGISASLNLLNNGYEDFIIIEANNRIGGRINTVEYNGAHIEIGAQYLHGQLENPIFYFSRENQLLDEKDCEIEDIQESLSLGYEIDSNSYYLSNDGEKLPIDLVRRANECFDKSILNARAKSKLLSEEDNQSFGSFLEVDYYNETKKEFKNELVSVNSDRFMKLINSIFLWRCKCENSINGSPSVYDMSLKYCSAYEDLGGNLRVQPLKGYKSIIDKMVSKHEQSFNERLKLNHSIKKILLCNRLKNTAAGKCEHCSYTNDIKKLVLLVNESNSLNELVILCENTLLTMSLGYLKQHLSGLVEPKDILPNEKLESINKLGFGTVNKIFLLYDKPFWEEGIQSMWLLKQVEKSERFIDSLKSPHLYEKDWTNGILDFDVFSNENACGFLCWMNQNKFYENIDDETVIKECTELFKKFNNTSDIPRPKKIFRSKWQTNKYFNGSYSYIKCGAKSSDFNILSEPISFNNKNYILFAGEHTHNKYFSTVHGAYLTGIRESNRILNKINA